MTISFTHEARKIGIREALQTLTELYGKKEVQLEISLCCKCKGQLGSRQPGSFEVFTCCCGKCYRDMVGNGEIANGAVCKDCPLRAK